MSRLKSILSIILLALPLFLWAQESTLLTGTVIGSEPSVDYSTGEASYTVNTCASAFDGDLSTFFASYERDYTWCGLDLGQKYVITRVAWSPRDDGLGPGRVVLAIFEGANEADFSDAIPLYINDTEGTIGEYQYADVDVSRAFRYVRYIGPHDARCNIAEVAFYGYASEGEEGKYYRPTNLPLVDIHIENNEEPYDKVNYLNCTITLIPSDPNDTIKTKTAGIRLRGNASIEFDKKPYRIKFDKKHHVFDSPASAKKWTLINNYGDKTLMRNILAFETSRLFDMPYTPYCKAVDVMVNGEYKGCYQLCDQVEVHSNRVDVEEMDETCTSGEELTGGYLIEVDAYAYKENDTFTSTHGNPVTIKYPDDEDITKEQKDYIKGVFNDMEDALYSSDFTSATGYRAHLDLETFLKHFLIGEFTGNTDTYYSVFMYKHRSDPILYVGPVWDFDLAFENDYRTHPINQHTDYVYTFGSWAGNMFEFANRIIKNDTSTKTTLAELWSYARRHGLTPESFLEYVDQTAELLDASQRLNFIRWPILSTKVHENWQASGSYEGEVDIVKEYIAGRFDWLDNKLGYDPSGIEEVESSVDSSSDNRIYTIDGRLVDSDINSLPKGIYIRNGKKYIVR